MDDDGHVLYIAEMGSCTHTHGHTHGFSFVFCFRLSACMQTYVHTYMHTDMHTYLHACPHRYVRTLWRWLVYIVTSSTLCSSKLGVRRGGCPNIFCQCFWGLLEGFGRRPMEHAEAVPESSVQSCGRSGCLSDPDQTCNAIHMNICHDGISDTLC